MLGIYRAAAQTDQIKLGYLISHKGDVNPFNILSDNRSVSFGAAQAVARLHAGG